jgi:molybdopterin synthase catalytic subunit/molybdopterin converting factor small subunit
MRVTVRLFAVLRERAGRDEVQVELADGATAGDALAAVAATTGIGALAEQLPLGFAVNRQYGGRDAVLADGDELALIPPISGGADGHVRITDAPLDVAGLIDLVRRPKAGAIVSFCGTTREVERLDYEAFEEMAVDRIRSILAEVVASRGLEAAAAEHRVGSVPLGEPSVAVAVAAAHRAEAFAGAREIIDRIKAEAPIWTREVTQDEDEGGRRAEWVRGSPPPVS